MESGSDQREFIRVQTAIETEVRAVGGVIVGWTQDVSLNGLYLACPKPFPAGSTCTICLYLDGREGRARIQATGRVARENPGRDDHAPGMAIGFTELIDVESYQHLKNLILYNSREPQKAEEEIVSHLGLKRVDPAQPPPGA